MSDVHLASKMAHLWRSVDAIRKLDEAAAFVDAWNSLVEERHALVEVLEAADRLRHSQTRKRPREAAVWADTKLLDDALRNYRRKFGIDGSTT